MDRLGQRQIGTTIWGSQIDEGVTFAFNCWYHYLETGDREALREPYLRLLRFTEFLERARLRDGLLPIEHVGGGDLGATGAHLGGIENAAMQRLDGDIAEVIAVRGPIAPGALSSLEGYLVAKYNLP